MKKLISVLLLAVLCVTAVAFCACTDDDEDLDVSKILAKCDQSVELTFTDGATINIQSDIYAVVVSPANVTTPKFSWVSDKDYDITSEVTDNTVNIVEKGHGTIKFHLGNKHRSLVLQYPASWKTCTLNATATTGAVYTEEATFQAITVSVTTGAIILDDITVKGDATLTTTTGAIKADIKSVTNLSAKTTTGGIKIDADVTNLLKAEVTTGGMNVDATALKADLSSSTGSVKFTLDAIQITATTTTGSVVGTIKNPKSLYTISATHGTGSCNLTNQQGTGDYTLTVSSTTGYIKVSFDN